MVTFINFLGNFTKLLGLFPIYILFYSEIILNFTMNIFHIQYIYFLYF